MLTQEQEKMLAQIGELVADCIRIGMEQERERCAALVHRAGYDMLADKIRNLKSEE